MAEVLVVGSGGREAAIGKSVGISNEVSRVVIDADVDRGLAEFSGSDKPFVIIGPESPLVDGLADDLRADGYVVFGVGKNAAMYEASKIKSSRLNAKYAIEQPGFFIPSSVSDIYGYVDGHDPDDYVIKADGLAGGKGVFLPRKRADASRTSINMWGGKIADRGGKHKMLFADRYHGPEVSAMVMVGGGEDDLLILPFAQDHKRLLDGDKGPNTGGMGAYGPLPETIIDRNDKRLIENIAHRAVGSMNHEGSNYNRGVLYIGFMMAKETFGRPAIIEYNVRFGDPEAQVIFPLLDSQGVDTYRLLRSAAEGQIEKPDVDLQNLSVSALTVCLAARGYPGPSAKGDPIWGLNNNLPENISVFPAAVDNLESENPTTAGGRVAYISAVGSDIQSARDDVYDQIDKVQEGPTSGKVGFKGMQCRTDIAHQVIKKVEN